MYLRTVIVAMTMLLSFPVFAAEKPYRDFTQIINSGVLRVGVSLSPPWVMRAKDGQLIGSEIDMANRLAADMGLKLELGVYEQGQLIATLEKGDIDIIASGMTIKPSRALRVNFSRPYGDAGIGLITNIKLTADFKSLQDLKKPGITIGVITDTVAADVAKRLFPMVTIKRFASNPPMEKALLDGDIYAVVASNPLPVFLALQYPNEVDIPLTQPLLSFKEGFAINKGDADFLNFINSWVVSHSADGWIASSRHYWLETLDWQGQLR